MDLPARIGKYELQEFLGGGMSHVYRAQDTVLGRTVAVKILTESGCSDPETKARFLQEARMAGNFTHDNIINVFDFGEEQGRPYIIMEFLRGETLKDAIKGGRTGDVRRKLEIAYQLAKSLEYIHSRKIVHRDIKPDNVHIDTTGRVKLMDFGIAKSQNVALTRVGFTLGTPYYMAPEQVLGQTVTALVDVYAYGIMLCEMLTGTKPITGESIDKVFQQILNEPLNLAPLRAIGTPSPVVDLIARCTAKNAQDRIQSFTAICGELERMLEATGGMPAVNRSGSIPAVSRAVPAVKTPVAPPPPPPPPPPPVPKATQPKVAAPPPAPPKPAPKPAPAPVAQPVASVKAAKKTGSDQEQLPDWMVKLPASMQTQSWFIGIVAVGVIAGMAAIVALLRALMRAIF